MSYAHSASHFLWSLLLLLSTSVVGEELASVNRDNLSHKKIRHWDNVGKTWLNDDQARLLKLAYDIGIRDGGMEQAHLLQAILMFESRAGASGRIGDTHATVGKRSYGIMQIKLITAYDVIQRHPEMGQFTTEEALIIRLVTDDEFNLKIASRHLLWLRKNSDFRAQAVMGYNTGLSKAKAHWYPQKFSYVRQVQRYLDEVVIPYNQKQGLKSSKLVLVE